LIREETMMEEIETIVKPEDERPARRDGTCFFCGRPIGAEHETDCVIVTRRRFEAVAPYVWQPIETLPEGFHVALYFPEGERGGPGGIEMGTVFFNDGDWSYWTHGSANSGSDWFPANNEKPTMWMRILTPSGHSV
jgi:hypothetical protein